VQSLTHIKALLDQHGLSPTKSLGQNFLIDHNLIRKLVDASGVGSGDLVLEIGPGTGTLTEELLERGCTVVACELDRGFVSLLRDRFADGPLKSSSLTLIEGDCLESKTQLSAEIVRTIDDRSFTLVANLPYGSASPLMATLATHHHPVGTCGCLGQFVTIQKEVAQRLRAQPGTKDYGELGIVIQSMCHIQRIAHVPASCFWPAPKIDSEMVAITPLDVPQTADVDRLMRTCRVLFASRRKQIGSVLKAAGFGSALPEGVSPTLRAENLTLAHIEAIALKMNEQHS